MHRCGGFFWLWYGERTEPGNENESRAPLQTSRRLVENAAAVTRIGQEKPRKMAVFHISGYFQIPPMMSETSPPAITQVIPNPLGKMGTTNPSGQPTPAFVHVRIRKFHLPLRFEPGWESARGKGNGVMRLFDSPLLAPSFPEPRAGQQSRATTGFGRRRQRIALAGSRPDE